MYWVDVLNEASHWTDFDNARRWLRGQDPAAALSMKQHGHVVRDQGILRRVFASGELQRSLGRTNARDLTQWVEQAQLVYHEKPHSGKQWLAADANREMPFKFSEALTSAIVQCLAFDWDSPGGNHVRRCRGVRSGAYLEIGYGEEWEEQYTTRAGFSLRELGANYHLCPQIISSSRGSRFCSKSCSNANFTLKKSLRDPNYFADKQNRYRRRQKRLANTHQESGALVFID